MRKNKIKIAALSLGILAFAAPVSQAAVLAPPSAMSGNNNTHHRFNSVFQVIDNTASVLPGYLQAKSIVTSLATALQNAPAGPADMDPIRTASIQVPKYTTGISSSATGTFGSVLFPIRRLPALEKFAPSWKEITATSSAAIVETVSYQPGVSLRDRMNAVNTSVNRTIRYARDDVLYETRDHWATPQETLRRGQGDCEDFAILKMALLARTGVSLSDMALVIVYDMRRDVYHAVLDVNAGGRHYILDNLNQSVVASNQLENYLPLYSIKNGKGYFHGLPKGTKRHISTKVQTVSLALPG